MSRLVLRLPLFSFLTSLSFATSVFAASVGVEEVAPGRFSAGIEYNRIFTKEMNPKDHADFKTMKIRGSDQVYGRLAYGLWEGHEWSSHVFLKAGAANLTTEAIDASLSNTEKIEYDTGFLWGIGASVERRIGLLRNKTKVVLNGQYNRWSGDIDKVIYNGLRAFNVSGATHARVSEMQAALLVKTELETRNFYGLKVVPYAGPTFDWMNLSTGRLSYETRDVVSTNAATGSRGDDHIGVVVGLDILNVSETLRLTLEARFVAETAFTFALHYRF